MSSSHNDDDDDDDDDNAYAALDSPEALTSSLILVVSKHAVLWGVFTLA